LSDERELPTWRNVPLKTYAKLSCEEVQNILNSRSPTIRKIAARMRKEGADGSFELEIIGPDEEEMGEDPDFPDSPDN
jgi:transposase